MQVPQKRTCWPARHQSCALCDGTEALELSGLPDVSTTSGSAATILEYMYRRLKPEAFIAGTDGFLRYFGAKFGDDLVAFENARYGNALYVMYEDWEAISRRSRIDLLAGPPEGFQRVEHRKGWKDILRAIVNEYRRKQRSSKLL